MRAENKFIITLTLDRPAYGGLSIGKWNGKIVMVKNAISGEKVEAVIEKEKKDYYIATATKILEPSPDRTTPKCKFYGICGGCQLQYIEYKRQVQLKEEVLQDCLRRLAKSEINLSQPLIHDNPWNYRHKGQFKISSGKLGFYKEKTRDVVDIDECPVMTGDINEYFLKAREIFKSVKDEYLYASEIHITYGDAATALIKSKDRGNCDKLAGDMLDSGFSGVFIDVQAKKPLRYGKDYTVFDLQGLKYTVSPKSFFQSHWRLNQIVVGFLKEKLLPLNGMRLLDLYSGAGNFSIPMAINAKEIIGVEENPYAIEDGKRNLKINGITNYRFIHSPIEALNLKDSFDILLIDPPRSGITNNAINKILALLPERIAYISCNPTTLARDLKKLTARYDIESARLIDFFPHTYHIESLSFLRLR